MSYRDRGAALERMERLEAALREGSEAKRPARWLKAIVLGAVAVVAGAAIVVTAWLVNAR